MKKAVYRLILFAAITAFVLSLSPSVKAEANDTQTKQTQCIASDTKTLRNADNPEPVTSEQPAVSKENSQLQLAKEQLRGDFYKDSADSLKWALRLIFTFFVAFVAYALFKNTKEYRQALADAKEALKETKEACSKTETACEKAREYELKAQEQLVSIDKAVKDKLEEIDTKAKEMMDAIKTEAKAGQVEIEKKGIEERQKSLKEAERQRKISGLYNKGWKADEAKDYETAADCYRQIVEELKEENNPSVYLNWGAALANLAKSKKGTEAKKLFNQAIGKYQKAIDIKHDSWQAYKNWSNALLHLARLKGGKDTEDLLKQAEEKCLKTESIKTGKGAYNLACVYALQGNEDKCQEWLKVSEKAGTLETREYAMADPDLKSVRDKSWFKKLRWKGE